MKKIGFNLFFIILFINDLYGQEFGVIADSIRLNPVRDSLDQWEIDSMLLADSLSGSLGIINWRRDNECADQCDRKYCVVRKIKNGNADLDFCNSDIPYIPVFQEYFTSGIDELIWNSAKTQEYSYNWGSIYTPTYPDGFGYYGHQRCDYFERKDNYENLTINGKKYDVKLMSIYNQNWPGNLSTQDRNEKAAENNTVQQWYLKNNAVVENGVLKLYTKYEPDLGIKSWYVGSELAARDENNAAVLLAPDAQLTTVQTFSSAYFESTKYFEYGMFQAKIAVPDKDGLWPAFWLMGGIKSAKKWDPCGDYYEELDIFEFMNNEEDKMITTIHAPARIEQQWESVYRKKDYFMKPHIYTCYWTECGIWIFLDEGKERKKILEYHHYPGLVGGDCKIKAGKSYYRNLRYPTQPMKIIFNTGVYACQNLKPSNAGFPVSMDIEWVKVFYQRPCADLKEVSRATEVNDLNQELFNVWSAKNVKVTGNERFYFQSNNIYVPTHVPLLKVIVENELEIEPTVDFEIGNQANFIAEFSDNLCQNYGVPDTTKKTMIEAKQGSLNGDQGEYEGSRNRLEGERIFQLGEGGSILLYPVPASGHLFLNLNMSDEQISTKVQFLNIDGSGVQEFLFKSNEAAFDVSKLSDGLYIVRIENDRVGVINRKISIVKQ